MPRKNSQDTQVISGATGSIVVNDTTEKVFNADMIVALEDTVIARIEVDGDTGTDVKATYITTAATALKKGAILTPVGGHGYFSAVTLTSGSVNLVAQNG
jgi:hypothetical protein